FAAIGEELECAAQDLAALSWCGRRPGGLCLGGGVDRTPSVGGRRVGDLLDDLAGGGIVDLDGRAGLAVDPLPADEKLSRSLREQLGFADEAHGGNRIRSSAAVAGRGPALGRL